MGEEKSRKEKRKEARLMKQKDRHLSWMQHQKSNKKEKIVPLDSKSPPSKITETSIDNASDGVKNQSNGLAMKKSKLRPKSTVREKKMKRLKRKEKTNFEEYLEMETSRGLVSAEDDLEYERKLAKKLKVKGGKLRGLDDGMNSLFDGISLPIESSMDSEPFETTEVSGKWSENHSPRKNRSKKRKPKSYVKEPEDEVAGDTSAGEAELETSIAEVAEEETQILAPVSEQKVKYVAPHLRSRSGNESEEYSQIRRRVKGLLNRLSESNVESTTDEMWTIFQSVSRNVASQIICEEVLAFCSGGPRGNEQYAAVFAAFVAGMACLVGMDFSAKLIASLAKSFEDEYLMEDGLSLRNLTLFLSYLFIFGVCSSDLIFDFLFELSKRLTELDVSTILTVLQSCGLKLRGDDPTAMKDFILNIQNRVNKLKLPSATTLGNNRRMEFMLDTICDIKNNKKRSKEDPAHHTRIKKWLQKLRVEHVLLRGLKWSKLLDPQKRGQWWHSGDIISASDNIQDVATSIDKEALEAQKLLQLAAAQRMNTDARRAIFCIIMSGDDYIDAFEKILRLDLLGKQDREIMRVLVECCLQEKVFNKYYTVLASKLCSHDKNHKFTLQIHCKRRNRLERKRLNALVFVKYNLQLEQRQLARRNKDNMDPICLSDMDFDDEWITEQEDSALPIEDTQWMEVNEGFVTQDLEATVRHPTRKRHGINNTQYDKGKGKAVLVDEEYGYSSDSPLADEEEEGTEEGDVEEDED